MKIKDLPKTIKNRLSKTCSICGKDIKVVTYTNRTYRGGHYFFDIPICSKKEWDKTIKAGTFESDFHGLKMNVLKRDPKPYKHIEYWECPKCYWKG